jgi:hypothetical protein
LWEYIHLILMIQGFELRYLDTFDLGYN